MIKVISSKLLQGQGEKNVITSLRKFIAYKHKIKTMKKTIFKLVVQTFDFLKFQVLIAIYSPPYSSHRCDVHSPSCCIFGES